MGNRINERSNYDGTAMELSRMVSSDVPYEAFLERLKKYAGSATFQKVLGSGRTDGLPGDEKIKIVPGVLSVRQLVPTQNEIGMSNSLASILRDEYDTLKYMLMGDSSQSAQDAIVTLNKRYIIDGHHRWSKVFLMNPDAKIAVDNIVLPGADPIKVLKISQLAIAYNAKRVPTTTAKGINILTAAGSQVAGAVREYITDDVIEMFDRYMGLGDIESIGRYIVDNAKLMRKLVAKGGVVGAPTRDYMPQFDYGEGWEETFKSGVLNYIDPKGSDVNEGMIRRMVRMLIREELGM